MARTDSFRNLPRSAMSHGPTSCSPNSLILPSSTFTRCPANTMSGCTATGDNPRDATAPSAALVAGQELGRMAVT